MPASAGASWTHGTVTSTSRSLAFPILGLDSGGHGFAAWGWEHGYGYAFRTPGGSWSSAVNVSDDDLLWPTGAYGGDGSGSVVLPRIIGVRGDPDAVTQPAIRTVHAGELGAEQPLDPGHVASLDTPLVDIDRTGRMLVAWTRADRGDGGVYAREVSRTGGLGPVARIETRGRAAAVALGDGGAAVVAWEDTDETLRARVRPRADAAFGKRDELGPFATEYSNDLGACCGDVSLALSPEGRALAAWTWSPTEDIGADSGSQISTETYVAATSPGGRFARAVHVDSNGQADDGAVATAFTRTGHGLAMWVGERLAYAPLRGTAVGARRTLGMEHFEPALVGGSSSFTAVWGEDGEGAGLGAARIGAGGAPLGPPESVPGRAGRQAFGFSSPALALDPRNGRPTALWLGPTRHGKGSSVLYAQRR